MRKDRFDYITQQNQQNARDTNAMLKYCGFLALSTRKMNRIANNEQLFAVITRGEADLSAINHNKNDFQFTQGLHGCLFEIDCDGNKIYINIDSEENSIVIYESGKQKLSVGYAHGSFNIIVKENCYISERYPQHETIFQETLNSLTIKQKLHITQIIDTLPLLQNSLAKEIETNSFAKQFQTILYPTPP